MKYNLKRLLSLVCVLCMLVSNLSSIATVFAEDSYEEEILSESDEVIYEEPDEDPFADEPGADDVPPAAFGYEIEFDADEGVTVLVDGQDVTNGFWYTEDTAISFTAVAQPGYELTGAYVDEGEGWISGENGRYALEDIDSDAVVVVTAKALPVAIVTFRAVTHDGEALDVAEAVVSAV